MSNDQRQNNPQRDQQQQQGNPQQGGQPGGGQQKPDSSSSSRVVRTAPAKVASKAASRVDRTEKVDRAASTAVVSAAGP